MVLFQINHSLFIANQNFEKKSFPEEVTFKLVTRFNSLEEERA